MRVDVTEEGTLRLREVYSGVLLAADPGEELAVCMRDGGFELGYGGRWYRLVGGELTRLDGTPVGAVRCHDGSRGWIRGTVEAFKGPLPAGPLPEVGSPASVPGEDVAAACLELLRDLEWQVVRDHGRPISRMVVAANLASPGGTLRALTVGAMPPCTVRVYIQCPEAGADEERELTYAVNLRGSEARWVDVTEWGDPAYTDEALVDLEGRVRGLCGDGTVVHFLPLPQRAARRALYGRRVGSVGVRAWEDLAPSGRPTFPGGARALYGDEVACCHGGGGPTTWTRWAWAGRLGWTRTDEPRLEDLL